MTRSGAKGAGSAVILDEIVARRRADVREARAAKPLDVRPVAIPHRFRAALEQEGSGLICEIKRASPSRGPIAMDIDPVAQARAYVRGGARAISVLTEPHWFSGSLADLTAVAAAVDVPVLCKDFIVDAYQIEEAAAAGACAVLLIVAALGRDELVDLLGHADRLGLDALVEVHTEGELATALETGARIVGVNNRDLKTLTIDLGTSERLIPGIPRGKIPVVESGLSRPDEIVRFARLGARAFLVGEALMRHSDPERAVLELTSRLETIRR